MNPPVPPALVLAAGLGLRLRPLTYCRAKPAVPVAGVPLIRRILAWLQRSGVADVVLNLHHLPETLTALVGDGADLGLAVRYSWEPEILGTAGGPRHALALLGPRFLIINGDTLADVDLDALVSAHSRSGAKVTLAVTANRAPDRYGGVIADPAGRVRGFTRPGHTGPSSHFVGVQVAEAPVFAALADGQPAATIGGLYDALLARDPEAVRIHVTAARFHDVGTADDYVRTSVVIAETEGAGSAFAAAGAGIHPSAKLTRTIVWDAVTIDRDSELTDCIVTDRVHVPAGSRFEREILLARSAVPGAIAGRRLADVVAVPLVPTGERAGSLGHPR